MKFFDKYSYPCKINMRLIDNLLIYVSPLLITSPLHIETKLHCKKRNIYTPDARFKKWFSKMINTLEQFGRNAGKVWEMLNANGSLAEAELIETTSLRPYEFHIAVGWLAKENKIRKDGEFYQLDETNLNDKIGEDAGKIWTVLYAEGKTDMLHISKLTQIEEMDTYLAIGWLARENKIRLKMEELHHQIKSILSKS